MSAVGRRNVILYRFLISYILILSISIGLFLVIYDRTGAILEEDTKKSNLFMLEQSRNIMDRHIQELDSIIERVALDPKIISLANLDGLKEGSADIDLLINAVNGMASYRLSNSFIKDFYIYFKASDIIMTASRANTKMRLQYGNYFRFGDLSYEEWVSRTAGRVQIKSYLPSTPVTFVGREYPVITKLQSIPLEYPKSNKGCIMAFIDTNAVNQLLQKINAGSSGYSYILDNDNSIITSVNLEGKEARILDIPFAGQGGVTNTRVSGEDMVVSYTISSVNNWKYVAAVPAEFVMRKVNSVRTAVLLAALVILVVGSLLSWIFSYKNAKPIKEICDSLKEFLGDSKGYKNEFNFLSGSIDGLINSNKDLGEKLNEQMPIMRAAFLRRLLHGNYRDLEEIDSNLSHLDIRIHGAAYVVVIMRISGYRNFINKNILKELDLSRLIINRGIEEKSCGRAVSCDLNETDIAFLLSSDSSDTERIRYEVESMAKALSEALHNRSQIYVSFAAGSIYTSLLDIGYSFIEAKQAADYIMGAHENTPVWYHQIREQGDNCKYTIDMERHLIELVRSGDNEGLERFLENIHAENFRRRKLPVPMQRLLLYQMTGTLTRLAEIPGMGVAENKCMEISRADDVDYAYHELCKCFMELADAVNLKKDRSDDLLCDKVLEFIDEAYKKEDLTLYSVAAHFNLTETYLYHFFREETGTTFASYLEKLRMERAYRLLTETGFSITEIALQVGYGSVHSFRRAFKRCRGHIPSDLRNA